MARRSVGRGAAAAAAFLFVAGAGCSGGGGNGGARSAGDACPAAPGVSQDSVRVGLIYPDTGSFAQLLTSVRSSVEARIALQNANGGVNGRQIALEWRDDASEAGTNLTVAEDLVKNENVLSMLEITLVAAGSAQYLDEAGVPVVGPATDVTWTTHRNLFSYSYGYGDGNSVTTFGQYVKQAGGTKAYLIDDFSATTLGDMFELSMQSQGIEIVGRESFSVGGDSPERLADRVAASGADVLLGGVLGPAWTPVVQAVNAARLPLRAILGVSGYDSAQLAQYGAALSGMSVYLPYTPFETGSSAIQNFRTALTNHAPQMTETDTEAAMQAYISTDLMIRGLESAGPCPTRASFMTGLRGVGDFDADGLLPGPVDMEKDYGVISPCYFFVKVDPTGQQFVPQQQNGSPSWCGERIARPQTASPR